MVDWQLTGIDLLETDVYEISEVYQKQEGKKTVTWVSSIRERCRSGGRRKVSDRKSDGIWKFLTVVTPNFTQKYPNMSITSRVIHGT